MVIGRKLSYVATPFGTSVDKGHLKRPVAERLAEELSVLPDLTTFTVNCGWDLIIQPSNCEANALSDYANAVAQFSERGKYIFIEQHVLFNIFYIILNQMKSH